MRKVINVILIILTGVIFIFTVYPEISSFMDDTDESELSMIKADIFEKAKDKFNKDLEKSDDNYKIYKVSTLIKEGYIDKKDIKKGYNEKSKVIVRKENGKISLYYINGDTIINTFKNKKEKDMTMFNDGTRLYYGSDVNNFVSFKDEIYRIVMIDSNGYIYMIRNECDKIDKKSIDEYLTSYYNDRFNDDDKNIVNEVNVFDLDTYKKTLVEEKSFAIIANDMWIKDSNDYKITTKDTLEVLNSTDNSKACLNVYLKIDKSAFVEKGNGSQFNPYILVNVND